MNNNIKININNIDYIFKIVEWNDERLKMEDGDFHFGVTNFKDKEIYIANNLSEQTKRTTIIHEITHAFIDSFGMLQIDWNDEIVADFISAHLDNINEVLETM